VAPVGFNDASSAMSKVGLGSGSWRYGAIATSVFLFGEGWNSD